VDPYHTKEGRAAILIAQLLEHSPQSYTRPELCTLMGLKVSAYANSIINWLVRQGVCVERDPKEVRGNLVRAYSAPLDQEGALKAKQKLMHLNRWIEAQKHVLDWNNGTD
jgi:hypothetical protein